MIAGDGEITRLPERVAIEEVERLLGSLSGIDACRVVANEWGALEEIHVLAGPTRHPKQAVRDVESALAAKWKLRVDHKKISVAQISTGSEPILSGDAPSPSRLKLESVRTSNRIDEGKMEVSVTLRDTQGETVEGSALSAGSGSRSPSVFAEAAVAAVNALALPPESKVYLEDLDVARLSSEEVVVCLLGSSRTRASGGFHSGSSLVVDGDRGRAAIESVIDAYETSNFTDPGGDRESGSPHDYRNQI